MPVNNNIIIVIVYYHQLDIETVICYSKSKKQASKSRYTNRDHLRISVQAVNVHCDNSQHVSITDE